MKIRLLKKNISLQTRLRDLLSPIQGVASVDTSEEPEALDEVAITHTRHRVENGEDMISYLNQADSSEQGLPDLIFLDLNMPGKNGLDTLREIRAMQRHDDIPVIFVTSSENRHEIRTMLGLKASAYIQKGIAWSKAAVTDVIFKALESKKRVAPA